MVVRPVALVVVAVLVVLGAAAGGFVAVRFGQDPVEAGRAVPAEAPADGLEIALDAEPTDGTLAPSTPVEVTEEVIEPVEAVAPAPPAPPPPAPPAPPSAAARPKAPAPAPAPRVAEADPPAVPSATRNRRTERGADDAPPPRGWERLSETWPTGQTDDERAAADDGFDGPDQIALRRVGREGLGAPLSPEPRPPIIEELVLTADSVIGLQVDTPITTETAEVEDDVEARVTRDVVVEDRVAIPAGTRVLGSVVLVEQGGRIKGASRLGVRFHTVVLDDVLDVPIRTETVYRESRGRGSESAAKIGGAAIGGAILGAIFGGGRGAAIGSAAGAAGGTAAAAAGDARPAELGAGTTLTVRLSSPATVTVEY